MGRVAWLIFVVFVSVCVVFCVLCCLQNNPVFLSVTIFHILKNENYELCFLANFFVDQITTGTNYDREKRDCVSFYGQCFRMSPYFICGKMDNYETSIYSHLGGCYVCVCCILCFVLLPKQSSVLECHIILYFEK